MLHRTASILLLFFLASLTVCAEDGSRLWLRYEPVSGPLKELLLENIRSISTDKLSPTLNIAVNELKLAMNGFTGTELPKRNSPQNHSLVLITNGSIWVSKLKLKEDLSTLEPEGFIIKQCNYNNKNFTVIASRSQFGILYGVFYWIRTIQLGEYKPELSVKNEPRYRLRMLDHWDNLDGSVERGYAGRSLWKWDELPQFISPRYNAYARANASVGINGVVLNNVNADPLILSAAYIAKVKVLADVFRPYGIKVFLAVNFASPVKLDGLANADPFDEHVIAWWKNKASEIYRSIPDFGGFLVKANSEGLPGPMDYGRTHADGANMLASALKPYGGIVIWRSFVYKAGSVDRATQAFNEFVPLDGVFAPNVILQVKNGPVDFQPREPFSPLFGAMKKTPVMVEFQITQEYLGFSNHLVFLAPLYEECLKSDTYTYGKGSTIAKITDGTLLPNKYRAIAGVANIGDDINWCGHPFAQANWYAFGRLAWDNELTSTQIADEWIRMTFTGDINFINPVKAMMLASREAAVNYMMPLGLHHIFAWGHHYGPEPWCDVPGARPDWLPKYYHKAAADGIGFDRTRSGSDAVDQYHAPLNNIYNNLSTCPEKYLLWFHHVPWDYKMKNGRILWDDLCYKYQEGVDTVRSFQKTWSRVQSLIDIQRAHEVEAKLKIQAHDAVWWHDACLLYFQTFSKLPVPAELEQPVSKLDSLMQIKLDMKHTN